jgi:hypothetical protein
MIPATAYSQIADLDNALTPTQTPMSTQCLDFNQDRICESIVLVNGTIIKNPDLPVTEPILNNNTNSNSTTPTVNIAGADTTVSEYYCTSNGCGYYKSGTCLDCDRDNNGIPDEMYDPRDPTMEGCDDPTLECGDPAFSIPPGEILRPTFTLNATGFSIADVYPNTAATASVDEERESSTSGPWNEPGEGENNDDGGDNDNDNGDEESIPWQQDQDRYDAGTDENEEQSDSCGSDGYNDGQNGPFDQNRYSGCGDEQGGDDAYYDGFIEGCMDADNSREVCEQATDAE